MQRWSPFLLNCSFYYYVFGYHVKYYSFQHVTRDTNNSPSPSYLGLFLLHHEHESDDDDNITITHFLTLYPLPYTEKEVTSKAAKRSEDTSWLVPLRSSIITQVVSSLLPSRVQRIGSRAGISFAVFQVYASMVTLEQKSKMSAC